MKRKIVFGVLALLFIGSSFLYAQSSTNLGTGVYRTTGSGTNLIVVKSAGYGLASRIISVLSPDGKETIMEGKGSLRNGEYQVDFGKDGFDIWTIVSSQEFVDGTGRTWRWVRQNL